tara:strand:+ start:16095 stop:16358 length:264 start_codon:yes stop_codon:yes gene_type:complete
MTQINVTETEHPAAMHQQDVNACIHHLRDAVVDYVESEVVTPGEFVNCVKSALNDSINHHQQRLDLLRDVEHLLNQTSNKELLNEEQ